jgi:hypothetical protein
MSTRHLGAPLRVFAYDPDQKKTTLLTGLGLVGIGVAFPVLYAIDPVAVGIAPLYFAPLVVLIGVAAIAYVLLYARTVSLTLYQGGFVYRGESVPYDAIRGISYELIHVIGSSSYNRGFFRVRLADGRTVSTSMQLERMEEVIGGVVQHAMPVLVEGIVGAVRAGSVVHAGPFELHPQGVVCKGKAVPWARAVLSSTGSNEHMTLMDVDPEGNGHVDVHKAKLAKVENADAVSAVAERLRVEALRARR